jgi:hypothetical protein
MAAILAAMPNLERRTAQRRLNALVAAGLVARTGDKRGARYRLAGTKDHAPAETAPQRQSEALEITLSPDAQDVLKRISRPETQRTPVGYRRDFLEAYRPNETFYLPAALRGRLLAAGRGDVESQAPAGTYARQLLSRLLIDLAWNSSRLEGNTYSLLDTERLLSEGTEAEGKSAQEAQMILNHKTAIEFLVESALDIGFHPMTIKNLHAALADNLLRDPEAPGRLRTTPVAIGRSVFHPLETPQLIEETFRLLLAKAEAIDDPYEQAFFAMVHLPYLQPFDDVNKRVSRLAANIPMVRRNLTPISFKDVPQDLYLRGTLAVYELNRTELLADVFAFACLRSAQTYAAIRQSIGEPDPFRMRWRDAIRDLVRDTVVGLLDSKAASRRIAASAEADVPVPERARFIEVVESELLALHDGNFGRYRIRPSEFEAWRRVWSGG